MEASLISDEARMMIGREIAVRKGVVRAKEFQRWAAAVGDHNPLYFDQDVAHASGYKGVVMPPMFVTNVVLGVWDLRTLRPDGGLGATSLPVPLPAQRMAGGEAIDFFEPVYDGDELTATSTVASIEEKTGRSGRFVIFTVDTVYKNQFDTTVAEHHMSTIAR